MNTEITSGALTAALTPDARRLASVRLFGKETLAEKQRPLLAVGLRGEDGKITRLDTDSKKLDIYIGDEIIEYTFDLGVRVFLKPEVSDGKIVWNAKVSGIRGYAVEYIELPSVDFAGALEDNGGDASVLWPYNEGVLITDSRVRKSFVEPEYPSDARYPLFPNIMLTQFMAYMTAGKGIYMGLEDPSRTLKALDFRCAMEDGSWVTGFRTRVYPGAEFGEDAAPGFGIVWKAFSGDWMTAAEIYRRWFEENLPAGLKKLSETPLPDWYTKDMPLVVTYPVRGRHDMDIMEPNTLFPYNNVLPYIDEFAEKTGMKIMVLLMHWEGTAPWAPPYVWPPFGGEEMFHDFAEELHRRGDLLGVYCSGFDFTAKSNLNDFDMREKIGKEDLKRFFCAGPDGEVQICRICTGQRSGYDICPACDGGKDILDEALEPLLKSGVDYVQVLDQNHGGNMYLCYSREHGHPPVPGKWMSEAVNRLLSGWRRMAPDVLLGCESAASEAFIGNLRLSDTRFEFCYDYGKAVPVYSFIYHEYLHNFMGNQGGSPLEWTTEAFNYRAAYAFLAGDMLTLIIGENGELMYQWGVRDYSKHPDRESVLGFYSELAKVYREYPEIFGGSRILRAPEYTCDDFTIRCGNRDMVVPAVPASSYSTGKGIRTVFVNFTDSERAVTLDGETFTMPPRSVKVI